MPDDPIYFDQLNVRGGVPIRGASILNSATVPIQIRATHTQLVEGQSGQGGVDDNLSYKRVITSTVSVKAAAGYLGRVFVGNATSTTMKIYDTTTIIASSRQGTIINTVTKVQFAAIQSHNFGWKFTKGIRVIFSTPSDVTFSYR